jgi:hypothetical protein
MSSPFDYAALKARLREVIHGPDDIPGLLSALGELTREMATARSGVTQEEREAEVWEDVVNAIDAAAEKAWPLRRIA